MQAVRPTEYIPCPKGGERNAIFAVLKALFGESPIALDFLDGDVRPVSYLEPIVWVAPPRLKSIFWILLDPSMNLPNAYVNGYWFVSSGELHDLILLLSMRRGRRRTNVGLIGVFPRYIRHIKKQRIDTSKTRETKNHYNIDHEIYSLILGPTMTYSCAFFDNGAETLEEAQAQKIATTIERLKIPESETSVLDIGCGWGTLTRELAKNQALKVEGISISEAQITYCQAHSLVEAHRSSTHASYRLVDYASLAAEDRKKYDRIVSVGMLEHVGKAELPKFFESIKKLLSMDGRAVIHSIVRPDTGTTNRWIDENIFAGGYIPRGSEVLKAIEKSKLEIDGVYYHTGENYQRTLGCWLNNLRQNSSKIIALHEEKISDKTSSAPEKQRKSVARQGYRVWEFYLAALQNIFHPLGARFSVVQYCLQRQPKTAPGETVRLGYRPRM